jgi:hypothetical protein
MASPTVNRLVFNDDSTATLSHTLLFQVPNPSAGELIVMFIRFAAAPGTITATGYTAFAGPDSSDASDDTSAIYYRWADGTEGGADTITTANSVKSAGTGCIVQGAENPATQAPQTSTVAIGTGANADPTTVTPTGGAKDYLWLSYLGMDGETQTASIGGGWSLQGADNSGTGGAAATNCLTWQATFASNAASMDPPAWTSSAPANGWTAWAVAVHPPAAATTSLIYQPALPTVYHL